jgi:hypothetical protein
LQLLVLVLVLGVSGGLGEVCEQRAGKIDRTMIMNAFFGMA